MKNKNLVLLAVAIGCGLVAAFMTAKLGAGNRQDMVPVLVAAKNLDQGTKLDKLEEQFVRKPFPRESLPPEYVDDPALLKDKVLQRSLRAGSHCTAADVTPQNTVELPIDPKTGVPYKALAIKVTSDSMSGGLILPGSRVDVVHVDQLPNGKTTSNMILQNVLVVAVDNKTVRPEDTNNYKEPRTVTLAVKQREGLVLAGASEHGHVTLMLRDPNDKNVTHSLGGGGTGDTQNPGQGGASGDDDIAPGVEKTKVLVAKMMITVGTQITEPEKLFEEKEWSGAVPSNFIIKVDELKGKVVTRAIPANVPATKESIEDPNKAGDKIAMGDDARHTMTIQIGPQVYYAHFRGNRLEENFVMPGSTPAGNGSAGSQEIKPPKDESKDENKDKQPERRSDPG